MLVKLYATTTVEAEDADTAAEIARKNVVDWQIEGSGRPLTSRITYPRMVSPATLIGIALFPSWHAWEYVAKYASVAATAFI